MANPLLVLAILAAPLAPAAASLVLTGLLDGRAGYGELAGRLRHWRVGWRWYAAPIPHASDTHRPSAGRPLRPGNLG